MIEIESFCPVSRAFFQMSNVLFKCKVLVQSHGVKKNSKVIRRNRRTGNRFIASNDRAKASENYLVMRFLSEKLKQRVETITTEVNAKFTFYYPQTVYFTKKGVKSKNLADISNLYETVQDALQKAQVIFDDNLICSHDGSRIRPIDDNNYWLEVEITDSV